MSAPRHFLDLVSLKPETVRAIIDEAHRLKQSGNGRRRVRSEALDGHTLAMLFEKPSTRTRFAFDVAMKELGGETISVTGSEMQLGRGESLGDTARVLSRYVDAVLVRMLSHKDLQEFARHAEVPVINGLTRRSHPCQLIADLVTIEERLGRIEDRVVAWVGDGNNVALTFMEAAQIFGFQLRVATPPELALPNDRLVAACAAGADVVVSDDPKAAVSGADVVVTDAWASMGDDDEARRKRLLRPFQVDDALMEEALPQAIFMHCLPAHRQEEVTDAVMDGPRSAVFDEAENRLHAHKAILRYVTGLI